MRRVLLGLVVASLVSFSVYSHSGRTNSSGCHNNRKTGDYHCHNSGSSYRKPTSNQEKTACCKICRKGKACGDSCISRKYTCYKASGCACDG